MRKRLEHLRLRRRHIIQSDIPHIHRHIMLIRKHIPHALHHLTLVRLKNQIRHLVQRRLDGRRLVRREGGEGDVSRERGELGEVDAAGGGAGGEEGDEGGVCAEGDGLECVGEVDGGAEDAVVDFDERRELVTDEVLKG